MGREEDVLDDTGVLLPAAAVLTGVVNLEGRHCMSLASSNSPHLPQCPCTQHSPTTQLH